VRPFSGHARLSIALNTDQNGRTFQDRSYVFNITKRPSWLSQQATIWNVNVRGRRGNIVQCYPAVEYDFVPQELSVTRGEYIHFQWVGSDFNPSIGPNNGEGWRYSDRHNLVEMNGPNYQYPVAWGEHSFFTDESLAIRLALQDVEEALAITDDGYQCKEYVNAQQNEQNDPLNCGKLNWAPAHFNAPPLQITSSPGDYYFVNTRDNNFSNRVQKFKLTTQGLTTGEIVAIIIGSVVGFAVLLTAAVMTALWRRRQLSRQGVERLCCSIWTARDDEATSINSPIGHLPRRARQEGNDEEESMLTAAVGEVEDDEMDPPSPYMPPVLAFSDRSNGITARV